MTSRRCRMIVSSLTFVVDPFGSFELGRLRRCLDEVKCIQDAPCRRPVPFPLERRIFAEASTDLPKGAAKHRGRGPDRAHRSSRRVVRSVRPHRPTLRHRRDPRLLPTLLECNSACPAWSCSEPPIAVNPWRRTCGCRPATWRTAIWPVRAELGYRLGAAYGLYWEACRWFAERCGWLDLGGQSWSSGPWRTRASTSSSAGGRPERARPI